MFVERAHVVFRICQLARRLDGNFDDVRAAENGEIREPVFSLPVWPASKFFTDNSGMCCGKIFSSAAMLASS
jgi:hypothetical protein